jgi:nucleotide-binding universal stress UspA family protein
MFRSILVPLDCSPVGEHALPLAATVARKAGGRVHLAHVHTLLLEGVEQFDSDTDQAVRDSERKYLERVTHRLKEVGVPADYSVLDGVVVDALEEFVHSFRADLIVMTTHGRGMFSRFWLGSVADQLLRRLTTPVLVVRPHDAEPDPSRDVPFRHALVPLDGSDLAEEALAAAVPLGVMLGARFTLLRVVTPPVTELYPVAPVVAAGSGVVPAVIDGLREEAEVYLGRVARPLRERGLEVTTRVTVGGGPASVILEEARAGNCDLIALATHRRRGLPRLFLGSVADKVVRGAGVPVLVLGAAGH